MSDMITGPMDEYQELRELTEAHGGRVTPELVLEAAAAPTSTFHSHFVWDDTEAAHRFRLQQAGGLIRKFKVVREVGGRTIRVPAFIRVGDTANGYAPTEEAVTIDWLKTQYRIGLIARLEKLAEDLRQWDEFTAIADAIVDTLASAETN